MSARREKESFIRTQGGLLFLRIVLNPKLTRAYDRAFGVLGKLPVPVQVSIVDTIVASVGRCFAPHWIREHSSETHHVPESTSTVAIQSGGKALYTGSGLFLAELDMNELVSLGLDLGRDEKQLTINFWKWLQNVGYDMMEELIRKGELKGRPDILKNDAFRTVTHEVCHWLITRGTSIATIVESVSWRATLEELTVARIIVRKMELLGQLSELKKTFDTSSKLDKEKAACLRAKMAKGLIKDQEVAGLLNDLIGHHNFEAFYYPTILSVILEPVTWVLVPEYRRNDDGTAEPVSYKDLLAEYFGEPPNLLYDKANSVLESAKNYLSERRYSPEARRSLIDAAREALNFPLRWSEELYELIGVDNERFQIRLINWLIRRFNDGLQSRDFWQAWNDETHLADAIAYSLWFRRDKATGRAAIREALGIVHDQPVIFNHFLEMALRSLGQPTFNAKTVVVNAKVRFSDHAEQQLCRLRYDLWINLILTQENETIPYEWVSNITNRSVTRLDDVVGDLPSTFPTALVLLHDLEEIMRRERKLKEKEGEEKQKQERERARMQLRLEGKGEVLKLLPTRGAYDDFVHLYRDILPPYIRNGLSYHKLLVNDPEENQLEQFLCFWIAFIGTMGENTKFLLAEHGMWA